MTKVKFLIVLLSSVFTLATWASDRSSDNQDSMNAYEKVNALLNSTYEGNSFAEALFNVMDASSTNDSIRIKEPTDSPDGHLGNAGLICSKSATDYSCVLYGPHMSAFQAKTSQTYALTKLLNDVVEMLGIDTDNFIVAGTVLDCGTGTTGHGDQFGYCFPKILDEN